MSHDVVYGILLGMWVAMVLLACGFIVFVLPFLMLEFLDQMHTAGMLNGH
jgi:hypothetical protein